MLERYIAAIEAGGPASCVEDERPDRLTAMLDALTLGFRLREGVSLASFEARFGDSLLDLLGVTGQWLVDQGFVERDGDRLRVAAQHQLITNEILVRLEEPLAAAAHARRETSASQIAVR